MPRLPLLSLPLPLFLRLLDPPRLHRLIAEPAVHHPLVEDQEREPRPRARVEALAHAPPAGEVHPGEIKAVHVGGDDAGEEEEAGEEGIGGGAGEEEHGEGWD